jgi:hypothetical protein
MTDAQTLRHQLRAAGYCPIPLFGKAPPIYGKNNKRGGLKKWQELYEVTPEMIDMWGKTWPDAVNTGVLTFNMPTLDADILDAGAAKACQEFVRERYGYVLTRIGKPPKFAIPFRTEEPFKKYTVNLIAPDDSEGQKIEFLADGEQVVVHGIHPDTKQPYRWSNGGLEQFKHEHLHDIREDEARALIDELVEILIRDFGYKRAPGRPQKGPNDARPHEGGGGGDRDWGALTENILTGRELHDSITIFAAKLIASGMNSGAAVNYLRGLMDKSTTPKDARHRARVSEIPDAVDSAVAKYGRAPASHRVDPIQAPIAADDLDRGIDPIQTPIATEVIQSAAPIDQAKPDRQEIKPATSERPTAKSSPTIDATIAVFKRWLVLSSETPVYAMLGTVAANLLEGDPVWLGLIAPPSSAKSELLNSIAGLPNVVDADTVTPSGLLSGTPKKQQDKGARGGLLRQIGNFGIITLKDFGSVLSMHAETRAETLAALRKIYNGAWTRHLGSAGGKTLSWQGKVAIIFAATEVIDAHHSVISSMGDRFLLSRLKPVTGKKQFARALKHTGGGFNQMRKELAAAVAKLFPNRRTEASKINEQETETIGKAIALAVRLRGAVARDYRSRELEAIYGAEGTARIGLALERLLAGLETLGMERKQALTVVEEVALDSVPPLRRAAYECVRKYSERLDPVETADVAIDLGLPTNTARRILEDLAAHGLIVRRSQGKGKADIWDKLPWEADEARADAKED